MNAKEIENTEKRFTDKHEELLSAINNQTDIMNKVTEKLDSTSKAIVKCGTQLESIIIEVGRMHKKIYES